MRALPMVEQAQDALVLLLKDIGVASGDWFTKPKAVTVSIGEEVWNKPRPCLCVVMTTNTTEAQLGERYQSETEFDIWCICNQGERESGTKALYRLMSDVESVLGANYRPPSGVFDSGHMYVTGSSVDFPYSVANNCLVGKVTVKCLYSWSVTAP